MKKERLNLYGMLILASSLAFCSCEKNEPTNDPDNPTESTGAYVVCQGNVYNKIPGMLATLDYKNGTSTLNAFSKANGRTLGDTPQCIVSYGSKLYIGTYMSNTIEIVDRATLKSEKQIRLGETGIEGTQPRSMVAHGGKVYIAMYDGYVASLDTVSGNITQSVKVGPNPEKIALHNGKLYVPNSDGMSYPVLGKTYSVIDLNSFKVTGTYECPENPDSFYSVSNRLFLLCRGNYSDVSSAMYEITEGGEAKKISDATIAAASSETIYMVNDPFYGSGIAVYLKYEVKSGEVTEWKIEQPEYAQSLDVDPVTGDILISSLVRDGEYPSFDAPGYVVRYDGKTYRRMQRFDVGSGPTAIAFNTK